MILWAEFPLINSVTSSTAFGDKARQQLTELIRQNYNHPSIVFWGIANEVDWPSATTDPNPLLAQLADLVDIGVRIGCGRNGGPPDRLGLDCCLL